jgi:hypothetical protein
MHHVAMAALLISVFFSCLAIGFLLSFPTAAKLLLTSSAIFAFAGTISAATSIGNSVLNFWAIFLSAASVGCALSAATRLFGRKVRWVHRFVIYTGYAATFAAMSVVALWLGSRTISGRFALVVLVLAYVAGSTAIFLAKTLIVRIAARTLPEYQASLNSASSQQDQPYW